MTRRQKRILCATIGIAAFVGASCVIPSTANHDFAFLESFHPHTVFDEHDSQGYRHVLLSFDGSQTQSIRFEMCRSLPQHGWKKTWESEDLDLQFGKGRHGESVNFTLDPYDLYKMEHGKRLKPHGLVDICYRESYVERLAYRIKSLFRS